MKLKVSNIVMTGKLPIKRKLKVSEIDRLITKAGYFAINEESSLILQKKIPIKTYGLSVQRKQKGWSIFIWASGAINIVGLQKIKEGKEAYNIALKDLKKYCRGVLK